ncbi:MAG: radical SAM protein [Clostridia bacterium]|nr:radical SAM protein [Clostridia bacterium]
MTLKEKAQRAAASAVLEQSIKYIKKNPQDNLVKLVDSVQRFAGTVFPAKNFDKIREGAADPDNVYSQLLLRAINDLDPNVLSNMGLALGLGVAAGTKKVRENREKYHCNIPFITLIDPTSACNLNCKGCWSAEYGHKLRLTYEEMESIVEQGRELGTHLYMFTGGEPLICKKEILKLCETFPQCAFLAYTNATLVDQAFCDELKRVGNLALAISIEGDKESNDFRRGDGAYKTSIEAMELLKKNGCMFGISVCYTSKNIYSVTSDEFLDDMIEKGIMFGLYFNYMPLGKGAIPELIPNAEQRKYMYKRVRELRNSKTGKSMFIMDFQGDGEYVGGCIAGGRNYFHINSAGDIEPCVFIHFSDSNIRTHTLLEALQNPLFMSFYKNQPFNDNHMRPCPMLENPDYLCKIVSETGAKSTDLVDQESAEELCAKCKKFAEEWAPVAKEVWESTSHKPSKTYYYRDTPEGKAELEKKNKN